MFLQFRYLPAMLRVGATFCGAMLITFANTWGANLSANPPNQTAPEREEFLSLADAVLRALEHNVDITIGRRTRAIRLTDIIFERAKFDPTVNLSFQTQRSFQPLNRPFFGVTGERLSEPMALETRQAQMNLALTQRVLTGANYELKFNPQRTLIPGASGFLFNPGYSSDLTFNLSQPLLRDLGPKVNKTPIRIAQSNAKVEDYVFLDKVLTIIGTVEQAYWELVFANENLKVAQASLSAAEELLASNRAKAQSGFMSVVDVLQAEAAVASRKEQVLLAEKAIRDQEDQLRRLMNPGQGELRRQVRLNLLDQPVQVSESINLDDAIETALQKRPEVLQAKKTVETGDLQVNFAKNQVLPVLAIQGSAGLSGLGSDPSDMINRNFGGDFYNWGVGLILSYPIGNRSAWSQFTKSQLEAQNAQSSLENAQQQVILSVKEAVRRVQTDFKRIETTRAARILAEKQLLAEQERLKLGLSITRYVVDFQRDLATARANLVRAIVDYNKSLSNLARNKASTLELYNIALQ
ncbi:MAG: hypothetical protein AUI03_00260 [Nitrospirae bacterium 13_2_20CM_2_62_8]|nr:MAG: hypothetical protein AUI03_00260 [Nitrospirae bacterium 13_2_20CM_2_62_8]